MTDKYQELFGKMLKEVFVTRRPLEVIDKYLHHFEEGTSKSTIANQLIRASRRYVAEE
tara:strand:+ start:30 stop:203 length:174 start_codon:yes stop_codon:yes gene_type:complete